MIGVINLWNYARGFGFIPDSTGKHRILHIENFKYGESPVPGAYVSFVLGPPLKLNIVISLSPRLLTIPTTATYIGGTNWHVEELYHAGELRYLIVGKHRVIDVLDLDDWVSKQKKQTGMLRFNAEVPVSVAAIEGAR